MELSTTSLFSLPLQNSWTEEVMDGLVDITIIIVENQWWGQILVIVIDGFLFVFLLFYHVNSLPGSEEIQMTGTSSAYLFVFRSLLASSKI